MKTTAKLFSLLLLTLFACNKGGVALRSATLVSDKAYPETGNQVMVTLQAEVVYKGKTINPDKVTWNLRDVRDNAIQPDRTDGNSMWITVNENGSYAIEVVANYPDDFVVRRNLRLDVKVNLAYAQANLNGTFSGVVSAFDGRSWPINLTLYINQTYVSQYLTNSNLGAANGNGKCFYFGNDMNIPNRFFKITAIDDAGAGTGTIALQDTFSFDVKNYPISNFVFSNSGKKINFVVRDLSNNAHYVQCSLVKN